MMTHLNVSSLVIYSNESSGCIFEYVIKMHIQMCRHETHSNVLSWYTYKCVIRRHIWICHYVAHLNGSSQGTLMHNWMCHMMHIWIWHWMTHSNEYIHFWIYLDLFTLSKSHGVRIFDLSHLVTIIKMLTRGLHRVQARQAAAVRCVIRFGALLLCPETGDGGNKLSLLINFVQWSYFYHWFVYLFYVYLYFSARKQL